ncbi:MAG: hypothetical protein PHU08_00110 [Dehalococcoidales bacterium]|nr:hypothetical protein [Dehalococcoidales bacterium]
MTLTLAKTCVHYWYLLDNYEQRCRICGRVETREDRDAPFRWHKGQPKGKPLAIVSRAISAPAEPELPPFVPWSGKRPDLPAWRTANKERIVYDYHHMALQKMFDKWHVNSTGWRILREEWGLRRKCNAVYTEMPSKGSDRMSRVS